MVLSDDHHHVVQFYDTEDFLCARVAEFLGAGLSLGEPLVVIATQARHELFQLGLHSRGFDIAPAIERGQIKRLDAHETLAKIMLGEMPDWDLFQETVGDAIEEIQSDGRPRRTRAYGEMVDILWRAGKSQAALRLEEMWNELARIRAVDLMCAYTMGPFYKAHDATGFRQICGTHSHVMPLEGESARGDSPSTRGQSSGEEDVRALAAEIAHRKEIELALRRSLHDLRGSEERERVAARRMAQLQRATASLATALTAADVAEVLLSIGENVLGAAASVVYLADEQGELRLEGWRGVPGSGERWQTLPDGAPLARAIHRREPIWIETYAALVEEYPQLASVQTPASSMQSIAALPLVHAGTVVGGFALSFDAPRRFDEDDRRWLGSLASQCALAAERVRLYEAERRARAEAEMLVENLTETVRMNELFTGVLAHDLRNPLGAIITAAQLAIMREQRDAGVRLGKPLSLILASGHRMARMVDQLLDFSRIRLGKGVELDPQHLDMIPLLRQVMAELDEAHPNKAMSLEHLGETKGTWDEDRLGQVFSNLIGNALQHSEGDRGVRVRMDGTDPLRIQIEIHNMGSIPADLVPHVFEPLVEGSRDKRKARGLGLGLFITRQIVMAHCGQIEVVSTEAGGTTFKVVLPRRTVVQ